MNYKFIISLLVQDIILEDKIWTFGENFSPQAFVMSKRINILRESAVLNSKSTFDLNITIIMPRMASILATLLVNYNNGANKWPR